MPLVSVIALVMLAALVNGNDIVEVMRAARGYAHIFSEYNAKGNEVVRALLGVDRELRKGSDRYARVGRRYENGKLAAEEFFDTSRDCGAEVSLGLFRAATRCCWDLA